MLRDQRPATFPSILQNDSLPIGSELPEVEVASTPSRRRKASSNSSQCSGGTASTIRSWASADPDLTVREALRTSAALFPDQTSLRRSSAPISPTAELENPPAPQSVTARIQPAISRDCRITSSTIFSVIALPICTAPPERLPRFRYVSSSRAERRAVDAVAPGASANRDDQIARARPSFSTSRRQAARPTFPQIDQRVAQVARIEGQTAPLTVGIPMRLP